MLQNAIHGALLALGEGSLERLEESLWQQQLLCSSLQHALDQLRLGSFDLTELHRILTAMHSLQSLSHTYAATVEQARHSTELLWKLAESYSIPSQHTPAYAFERHRRSSLCMA